MSGNGMNTSIKTWAGGMLLALAVVACVSPGQAEPCAPGANCEPRSLDGFPVTPPIVSAGAAYDISIETPSLEDVLEEGYLTTNRSPVHVAARATAQTGTVRCDWHGIVRTLAQREQSIRFWLDIDDDTPLPSAQEVERRFMTYVNSMEAVFRPTWTANISAIARGGVNNEYALLTCYADYTVNEYLLGAGANALTVAYDTGIRMPSYGLYERAHAAGALGSEDKLTGTDYAPQLQNIVDVMTAQLRAALEGRESVVFLAPMGAHGNVAIEAWQAVGQWDLQVADDGTVNAVRYGVPDGDPEHTQTLANLKSRVTTAAASDAAAGERIANISGLTQYYRDIGAYGDITPGDDEDSPFTPAKPPAATITQCRNGGAVPRPDDNPTLLLDCAALLRAKDALRGTAPLNWSHTTSITTWDGVTVDRNQNDSLYVRDLALADRGFNGFIPSALVDLTALRRLDLDDNALSGSLPPLLANLTSLQQVYVSGNELSGTLPPQWADLPNLRFLFLNGNDLSGTLPPEWGGMGSLEQLVLDGNGLSGEVPSEWGGIAALEDLFLRDNALSGSIPRELDNLGSLEDLYLEGNAFTGCIPAGLRDTAEHDLATLGLPYCAPGS